MILAILFSLLVGFSFCLVLFACLGLPLYMSALYVATGIAASLVVLRFAARRDPLKRLKRFYVLGALAGAAVGLLTNGLFSIRFGFQIDAATLSGLTGGLGAVLYTIMSVATERPPKARPDREEVARFLRNLRRAAHGEE